MCTNIQTAVVCDEAMKETGEHVDEDSALFFS